MTDFEALGRVEIGHTTSPLGSGGMRSKVVAAEMATAAGIPAVICNGLRPGVLEAVLAGRRGRGDALPGPGGALLELQAVAALREAVARDDRGRLRRGAGAARRRHARCCRSGIVDVRGGFEAGDAVHVTEGASVIGKGITNYSAPELRQVMGMKSTQVREVLPRATEEAVHRDYFVLV